MRFFQCIAAFSVGITGASALLAQAPQAGLDQPATEGQRTQPGIFQVPPGQTITIDRHDICRTVENGTTGSLMVPTMASAEWKGDQGFLAVTATAPDIRVSPCVTGVVCDRQREPAAGVYRDARHLWTDEDGINGYLVWNGVNLGLLGTSVHTTGGWTYYFEGMTYQDYDYGVFRVRDTAACPAGGNYSNAIRASNAAPASEDVCYAGTRIQAMCGPGGVSHSTGGTYGQNYSKGNLRHMAELWRINAGFTDLLNSETSNNQHTNNAAQGCLFKGVDARTNLFQEFAEGHAYFNSAYNDSRWNGSLYASMQANGGDIPAQLREEVLKLADTGYYVMPADRDFCYIDIQIQVPSVQNGYTKTGHYGVKFVR